MKSKVLKNILKLLVSLSFVAWIIMAVNWQEVLEHLSKIKLWGISLYILLFLLGIVISSYKWRMLAQYKGVRASFKVFFKYYLTGIFINNFLPSFIGGDTYKAYQLGKEEKNYAETASSVIMDRVTGLLGAMILTIVFSVLNWKVIGENNVLVVINLVIVVSLIIVLILIKVSNLPFWSRLAPRFPKKLVGLLDNSRSYTKRDIMPKAILWSFLFSVIGLAAVNYVLFLSLGVEIGVLNYLSVIFVIAIVSSIPVSINNIGIKEWAYITFFGLFGVSSSAVITVALVSRFLQMIVSFIALPIYLRNKKD